MKKLLSLFLTTLIVVILVSCNKKEKQVIELPAIDSSVETITKSAITPVAYTEKIIWSHSLPGEFDYETIKPVINLFEGHIEVVGEEYIYFKFLHEFKEYVELLSPKELSILRVRVKYTGRVCKDKNGKYKLFQEDGLQKITRREAHIKRGHIFNEDGLLK